MICPESHQTILQQRQFLTMLNKGIDNDSRGTVSVVWVGAYKMGLETTFFYFSLSTLFCV